MKRPGRLYAGTSGFSYTSWVPRFYAPGKVSRKLLPAYAARLPAVELNNTFYRRPSDQQVAKWLAETPAHFRFCPKAQRGTSWRAWSEDDPADSIAWLTTALTGFGERLGCVLLSVLGSLERDDLKLERILRAWPVDVPLALELPHPSWDADEVHAQLRDHGVSLVATDWDDRAEPDLRRIGSFLYLRLRRAAYSEADLQRWAQRLEPFIADGMDAFVFLRHDQDGTSALQAERLIRLVGKARG
ncbi:MAG: DUF72 domain-containing protein [Chloroflexota bacterium]